MFIVYQSTKLYFASYLHTRKLNETGSFLKIYCHAQFQEY